MPTYVSERGHPLVYAGEPSDRPVLTVENYCKWYNLYAVDTDGTVIAVETDRTPGFESSWRDHVPHPAACEAFAKTNGWEWDENSLDMIYGRYAREVADVDWGRKEF